MFKINKNYLLTAILIFGLSGCAERRVITINTNTIRETPIRHTSPQREERVQEEILIKNNPNLVHIDIVPVPKNNPSLAIKVIENRDTQATSSELNGQIMDRMSFPIEEYRVLRRNGNSTVSGRVFLENSINDEKIIRKNLKLYLNPVTSYSKQWYEESYLGGYKMTPPDKRIFNYLKFTTTNQNGDFSFFGIPAGEYYIGAKFNCGNECGYNSTKIIRVVKEVSVGYGTTQVELTKVVP